MHISGPVHRGSTCFLFHALSFLARLIRFLRTLELTWQGGGVGAGRGHGTTEDGMPIKFGVT